MDEALTELLPPDWPAIKFDYEDTTITRGAICEKHGITRGILARRARRELWKPRFVATVPDRPVIIRRLFHLLEKQIVQLEDTEMTGEKEVAALGRLASTLEKLINLDNAEAGRGREPADDKDMKELRHKLARRIAQLKRA